ncbi:hypothetical protein Purlil1_7626 [Purpureocillium lilacinum]|uniref:Uncharacterized protein n=1 Tax=Purpureocillium lilacinum TaxID=33203 RepID=A0ABR0BVW4_PURLI|nr:hypothetical protein Purlil1_7626 [Purpureocillium lilacinum]
MRHEDDGASEGRTSHQTADGGRTHRLAHLTQLGPSLSQDYPPMILMPMMPSRGARSDGRRTRYGHNMAALNPGRKPAVRAIGQLELGSQRGKHPWLERGRRVARTVRNHHPSSSRDGASPRREREPSRRQVQAQPRDLCEDMGALLADLRRRLTRAAYAHATVLVERLSDTAKSPMRERNRKVPAGGWSFHTARAAIVIRSWLWLPPSMYPRVLHILHPLTGSSSSSPPPSPPPSRHDEHASLRQASDARVSEDLEHRLTEHKKSNSLTRIGSCIRTTSVHEAIVGGPVLWTALSPQRWFPAASEWPDFRDDGVVQRPSAFNREPSLNVRVLFTVTSIVYGIYKCNPWRHVAPTTRHCLLDITAASAKSEHVRGVTWITVSVQGCLAAPLPQTARHRRSKSIDGKAAAKMCTHYPRGPESAVMDARVLETSTRGLNPLDDVVKVADCISTLQRDKRSTAWLQRLRVLNDAIVDPPASCW